MNPEPLYEVLRYRPNEIEERWLTHWAPDTDSIQIDSGFFHFENQKSLGHARFFIFQDFFTRCNKYFSKLSPQDEHARTEDIADPDVRKFAKSYGALTNDVYPMELLLETEPTGTQIDRLAKQLTHSDETTINETSLDVLRLATLRNRPYDEYCEATNLDFAGSSRFLQRVWRLARTEIEDYPNIRSGLVLNIDNNISVLTDQIMTEAHKAATRKSTSGYLAQLASFNNELYRYAFNEVGAHDETMLAAIKMLVLLVNPACPFISAELWQKRKGFDC